jgi:hypothetical protein
MVVTRDEDISSDLRNAQATRPEPSSFAMVAALPADRNGRPHLHSRIVVIPARILVQQNQRSIFVPIVSNPIRNVQHPRITAANGIYASNSVQTSSTAIWAQHHRWSIA